VRALYLLLLVACLALTLPLELVLGARVYRRPLRLALSLLPVLVPFLGWDLYAIARHQWSYSRRQTLGWVLPGHLPVEEVIFFVVVPICSILTLEAVRRVRGWPVGDEPDR
jgi:lycopene cyclase domain-containing protein